MNLLVLQVAAYSRGLGFVLKKAEVRGSISELTPHSDSDLSHCDMSDSGLSDQEKPPVTPSQISCEWG
jgi:hypothetical protein